MEGRSLRGGTRGFAPLDAVLGILVAIAVLFALVFAFIDVRYVLAVIILAIGFGIVWLGTKSHLAIAIGGILIVLVGIIDVLVISTTGNLTLAITSYAYPALYGFGGFPHL